jgi:alkylation response protein AidB-like acyl-CoA dehydrogenase
MKFHLSEEQSAIQEAVRGTLEDSFGAERRTRHVEDDGPAFDPDSWNALMALGLGGLVLPEADGGSGLGVLDLALSTEMLGYGAAPGPVVPHLLVGLALSLSDDAALRDAWLPGIASGETVATVAWGGEWLPESWDVPIEHGALNGKVGHVIGGSAARLFLVGTAGGGLALAEAGAGLTATPLASSDRTRRASAVTFDKAPASVLFEAGDARVSRLFDAALILGAAEALGGAQRALDLTTTYAKEREQFGQPIGRFQALKHQLATMAIEVEPARALLWYAGYAWDSGQPDTSRAAALSKAHIADRFVSVARAAVAAHGGIGYTWEYALSIWFRRSLADRAMFGAPAVHRARAADLAGW